MKIETKLHKNLRSLKQRPVLPANLIFLQRTQLENTAHRDNPQAAGYLSTLLK
jgi:hypothetical protein